MVIDLGGHSCKMAGSLQEALNLLWDHPFDLVIVEFKLDGSNWDQTVKTVRNVSPEVPVMILTKSSDVTRETDKVLVNARSPDELLQHIKHALGRKS